MGSTGTAGWAEPTAEISTGCFRAEDEEVRMAGPEDLRLGTYQPSLKFK
jgi:hypothetical protein